MQGLAPEHQPASSTTLAAALDATGWGIFFIWVGVCVLADLGWSVFFLGTGMLMLAGQAARRHVGLVADRFALLLGACFAVVGVARLLELGWPLAAVPAWAVPAFFMAFGAGMIVLAWRRGRGS